MLQNDKNLTNSGTGHGVGAYLNVHEGPMGIGSRAGETNGYPGLQLIPILNTWPTYYEKNMLFTFYRTFVIRVQGSKFRGA